MRVVLVGPEKEENLSIRYLSSSLLKAGHDVQLAAFNGAEDEESVIAACADGEIIGLSMCFQARAREFLELARTAKLRYPNALVVAGGHFASCVATDLLLNHPEIDLIVIHEGENTLVEIADWYSRPESSPDGIRGIAFRNGTDIRYSEPRPILEDLDALPTPDRRGPVRLIAGIPTAYLFGSRGCLSSCDYCCIKTLHSMAPGKSFRQRDPEKIADEMSDLYYGRGIRQFIFHDDNFLVPSEERNHRRLDALEQAFRKRGFGHIGLYIKCRPGDLTPDIARRLQEMGVVRLFMGIESSSSRGYASLGRHQTVEESERAFRACDEFGISAQYTLLMFHPEATIETLRSDIDFMHAHINHPFNFGRVELNAGTPIEGRMIREGRTRGNYLGRGYSLTDPVANLAWEAWRAMFLERCSEESSLMNNAILLDFLSSAMNRFYDGPKVRRLSREIEEWRLSTARSSLNLVTRLVDACEVDAGAGSAQLGRRLRRLKQEESVSRTALHAEYDRLFERLNSLTLGMVGLEDQNGRIRKSVGIRGTVATHVLAVALAFQVAGTVPAFGCCDMEQRVLDADGDGLFDDLESGYFGTDPDLTDTDHDDTPDAEEDHDGDGTPNLQEQIDHQAFVRAARNGNVVEVRRLIAEGAELDLVDPESELTALTTAAESGSFKIAVELLNAGADVNAHDAWSTPLFRAAAGGHNEVIRLLLGRGAEMADVDGDSTLLIAAARAGSSETFDILLEAGEDPNATDYMGRTALYFAAWWDNADAVGALIDSGAGLDARTSDGQTALMLAASRGYVETVRVLVGAGAEIEAKDENGQTALSLARERGHTRIVALLRRAAGSDE